MTFVSSLASRMARGLHPHSTSVLLILSKTSPRIQVLRLLSGPTKTSSGAFFSSSASPVDGSFVVPPAPYIPPPPEPPVPQPETLADLGLGGFSPWGLVEHGLDALHSLGLPWWASIVVGAWAIRIVMIPLFAAVNRNSIQMVNHAPEMQKMQIELLVANQRKDRMGALKLLAAQKKYMKDNDLSHFRQFRVVAAQSTVFVSMFWGLKAMANLPVPGFTSGGLAHILDLTIPDPYFILPILASSSMFFIIIKGAEGMNVEILPPTMKKVMMILPLFVFGAVSYFPAGMGVYWVASNFFSVGQFFLFKSEAGRKFFNIPEKRVFKPGDLPTITSTGFAEQFARSMEAAQEAARAQSKLDSMQIPDDRSEWRGSWSTKDQGESRTTSNDDVASRQNNIRQIIREINEMKRKIEDVNAAQEKNSKDAPPEIHIKIPKENIK